MIPSQVDGTRITVSAGCSVHQLMKLTANAGISGFEFMAGVPASVGGMITMNFGCWEQCIADRCVSIDVLTQDGDRQTIPASDCGFGYRQSHIKSKQWIVLSATLEGVSAESTQIKSAIQHNIQRRLEHQPLRGKTFGCMFKNPPNQAAGHIIQSTGLKGKTFHNVECSDQHANFLVNTDQASFQDCLLALTHIQESVRNQHHIDLELEVEVFH